MYSEALEQQLALLRWWQTDEGGRVAKHMVADLMETYGSAPSAGHFVEGVSHELSRAETFFVSNEMGLALQQMAGPLPSSTLSVGDVPVGAGFVYFDTPLVLAHGAEVSRDALLDTSHLRAFTWEEQEVFAADAGMTGDMNGIALTFYVERRDRHIPGPFAHFDWLYGTGWGEQWLKPTDRMAAALHYDAECRRLVSAFFLLTQQRIFVAPHRQAERHARKRLERDGWTQERLIRVVQLRRKERVGGSDAVQPTDHEWHCQWVVRGHWRQQPCGPASAQRRPVWVTPYVKGPEDKPLKAPRATVFAVVR